MKQIHVEASTYCNARCPLCPRSLYGYKVQGVYPEVHLSVSKFQECLKQFPNKTQKDLYPEQYEEIKRRQIIEQNIKVKASKLRVCPKCKQKLSTTKNRYARSLDEGVDLTATCVFCGFSWAC